MSFLSSVLSVFGALGRFFTGTGKRAPETAPVPSVTVLAAAPATAVAGFVYRVPFDRFFLASRLKSVAKLNTPLGRKPRSSSIPQPYAAAVPAERLGAKKIRSAAGRDLRVLSQIQARNARSAEIIPFPVARRGISNKIASVAQAA